MALESVCKEHQDKYEYLGECVFCEWQKASSRLEKESLRAKEAVECLTYAREKLQETQKKLGERNERIEVLNLQIQSIRDRLSLERCGCALVIDNILKGAENRVESSPKANVLAEAERCKSTNGGYRCSRDLDHCGCHIWYPNPERIEWSSDDEDPKR